MSEDRMHAIVRAQSVLVDMYGVTSETALGLLVWAATDDGVTVLEVATSICNQALINSPAQSHAFA